MSGENRAIAADTGHAADTADEAETAISTAKRQLRGEIRSRRRAMTPEQRETASAALTAQLIQLVRDTGAHSLSCYLAMPSEPDTAPFLAWAAEHDIDALLPKSLTGHRLGWIRPDGSGTTVGAHGISEPNGALLPGTAVAEVDLMLIPASAVDARGIRMGWGLGYYDRCLAALETPPPVYAVVFDEELLDEVPALPHDSPVTGAVTPGGIHRFDGTLHRPE